MKPLITIIVPVYQVEPYLKRCIESIINQTYEYLEIILVDDGSIDGSGAICDQYGNQDTRVKVIHKENGGLSSARNTGLDIAEGEYIAFVDSDDYVGKRYIEKMYEIMRDSDCDIVQCSFQNVIDDDAREDRREGDYTIYSARAFSLATYTLLSWKCNVAWNKLYKASLFDDIRYPVGKIHEDEFTTYKLIWKAERVAVTNTKLYFYRQRANSIMGEAYSLKRLHAGEAYREREKFYQDRNEKELLNFVRISHLEWIGWQMPLLEKYGKDGEKIITELKKEQGFLKGEIEENSLCKSGTAFHGYLFPFDKVPYGSRIILYGAGDVGVQYYRQIMELNYCDVAAWVDKDAAKYKKAGFQVTQKNEVCFDRIDAAHIVIAINNDAAAKQLIHELMQQNDKQIIYQIIKV